MLALGSELDDPLLEQPLSATTPRQAAERAARVDFFMGILV